MEKYGILFWKNCEVIRARRGRRGRRGMVKKKIRCNKGASLSMALLLFLVCTVAGSVVLTAATAASGRLSDMAEMDQRYYSVSSAAALLARELDGKSVRIEREKDENEDGDPIYSTTIYYNESETPVTSMDKNFLTETASYLMFGDIDDYESDDAWACSFNRSSNSKSGFFNLVHSSPNIDSEVTDLIKIRCDYTIDKDEMIFTIKNDVGSKKYTLELKFVSIIRESLGDEQKDATISWSVSNLRAV